MDFIEFRELLKSDRTVRRFKGDVEVSREWLAQIVELARYCASGRNAQPLRYVVVDEKEMREKIYPLLKWAGYYKDWDGPEPGERPSAYLVQCLDTHYGADCLCDDGLQLQAMTLGLTTLGLGGCIIKAFDPVGLASVLHLDARYKPRYVLAVGVPAEEIRLENMDGSEEADFKYYRTPDGVHHVPKRPLSELIL